MSDEAKLVQRVREIFGAVARESSDDDAARLPALRPGNTRVMAVDPVVEGVHFRLEWGGAGSAGWRAVVRNLSDLAASGARPVGFVWSLVLPSRWLDDQTLLDELCEGAAEAAGRFGAPLLGGDVARGEQMVCTVSALGDVAGEPLTRAGARPGQGIYLSRPIGHSLRGLEKLRAGADADVDDEDVRQHLYPEPELAIGADLVGRASACMDISDGLGLDLARLAQASGVGADVEEEVPNESGGDYALLFSAEPARIAPLLPHHPIRRIGTVSEERGVRGVQPGGWDHFASSE